MGEDFTPHNPYLAVDAIIDYEGKIVLVKRKNPPVGWALPGGFVEYGEPTETAVEREAREETGLDFWDHEEWKVFSEPERDPRQHVVTVCFVGQGKGQPEAGSDAGELKFLDLESKWPDLVFDHEKILSEYVEDYVEGGRNNG